MRAADGVIDIVQEGRFRLVLDDGRSGLFVLSRSASLEPQDLGLLSARRVRVRVHHTDMPGRGAGLAHDIAHAPPMPPRRDLPNYFGE